MCVRSAVLRAGLLGAAAMLLSGCLVASVAGTAVGVAGTAVGVTAKAAGATAKVGGAAVGAMIPDGGDSAGNEASR